jgi:uncharacterized membrane protein YsdA (DUF1294 family)
MERAFLLYLAAINLVTFLAFGWDKRKARLRGWRTPEARLLLLSFLGGFVGGWLGMKLFRHKTVKTSFRAKMLLVSVVNPVWVVGWWWFNRG